MLALGTWRSLRVSVLDCFSWHFAGKVALVSLASVACAGLSYFVPACIEFRFLSAMAIFGVVGLAALFQANCLTEYEKSSIRKWLTLQWLRGSVPSAATVVREETSELR